MLLLQTIIFTLALFMSYYSILNIILKLTNLFKHNISKNVDLSFPIISCMLWGLFYHLIH